MAWSTPRTWNSGETVTATLMNTHVRDNENVLKTNVADAGQLLVLLKGFGYSSGQGNAAGGADTQLTSYDVTIPANYLAQPGDAIVVEGVFSMSATSESKAAKIQVGGGTLTAFFGGVYASPTVVVFRLLIKRRTSSTGSITGWIATGASGSAPSWGQLNATAGTVDWTSAQTLKIFCSGATATSIFLTDYSVRGHLGITGSLV